MRLFAKIKMFSYSIIQYNMPKLPRDHSNTIIYKLVHKEDYDNANIYIGSTTDFIRRKNSHKNCCNMKNARNIMKKNISISVKMTGGENGI